MHFYVNKEKFGDESLFQKKNYNLEMSVILLPNFKLTCFIFYFYDWLICHLTST